jgi:hypothetical protein
MGRHGRLDPADRRRAGVVEDRDRLWILDFGFWMFYHLNRGLPIYHREFLIVTAKLREVRGNLILALRAFRECCEA